MFEALRDACHVLVRGFFADLSSQQGPHAVVIDVPIRRFVSALNRQSDHFVDLLVSQTPPQHCKQRKMILVRNACRIRTAQPLKHTSHNVHPHRDLLTDRHRHRERAHPCTPPSPGGCCRRRGSSHPRHVHNGDRRHDLPAAPATRRPGTQTTYADGARAERHDRLVLVQGVVMPQRSVRRQSKRLIPGSVSVPPWRNACGSRWV